MAFCGKCGTNLQGQAYCTNCGAFAGHLTTIDSNVSIIENRYDDLSYIPLSKREQAMRTIENLIFYYEDVKPLYNDYMHKYETVAKLEGKNYLRRIFFTPVIWILGVFIVSSVDALNYSPDIIQALLLLAIILGPILFPIFQNTRKKKTIKQLNEDMSKLGRKLVQHYESYNQEMPIGYQYFNPPSLQAIHDMLYSGRAETIPEALNKIKDDAHQSLVEEQTAQAAYNSRLALEYAKEASEKVDALDSRMNRFF